MIGGDVIELRRRLVVLRTPAGAAVHRDRHAAVVGIDHVAAVERVDPEVMIVAVRGFDCAEGAPGVDRLEHRGIHDPDDVRVLRVGRDLHVVPAARLDQAIARLQRPRPAGIVGPVQPAALGLHDRVHAVRGHRRYADADLAHQRRQALGEPRPAVAAVDGLPDPAALTTAAHHPRRALVIPEGGVEDARIRRVHRQIAGTAEGVQALQHLHPGRAAITRAVDAAIDAALPAIALRGHVHHVRVGGMHAHRRDLSSGAQAHVAPRASLIGAAIDAVAVARRLPADRFLARADIQHVRI